MKKIIYLLFLILLIPSLCSARDTSRGVFRVVGSGSVTQANMRLSGVDGTAFVDFGAANVLTTKIGHLLKITDSANKSIMGYIKAAGTGETLGDEKNGDVTFDNAGYWTTLDPGWAVTGGQAVGTSLGSGYYIRKTGILTATSLLYYSFDIASISSGGIKFYSGNISVGTTYETTGTKTGYQNSVSNTFGLSSKQGTTTTATCDNLSLKQVLTPSSTGVTIVSSKGGTTYNWFNKNSAFNWNDAYGYTYQIIKENRAVTVATSSVSAGNALIDATTANAFAAPVGVDLTAYQDGRHLAHFTDSSGQVAVAWISSTAPSGEALSDEIIGNTTFDDASWWDGITGGYSVSGGVLNCNSPTTDVKKTATLTAGKLYKRSVTITRVSGVLNVLYDGNKAPITMVGTTTNYFTPIGTILILSGGGGSFVGTIDNPSLKQVTMPAATGALLLSSKGGSRGWLYKSATFDPNLAQTLKILYYGD